MKKNFNFFFRKDFTSYYPLLFTIVFVSILLQYKFPQIEATFYDLRVRFDIGATFSDDIVLVTIDEESDEFLGESFPYTYRSYVKLIDRLLVDSPRIINIFGELSEPITDREERSMAELKNKIIKYKTNGGVFRFATGIDSWGETLPPEGLRDLGFSPAIINIDSQKFSKDKVARRTVLNISGEETLHFWTANEYRILQRKKELMLNEIQGAYYVREADASFSLYRYYTSPIQGEGHLKTVPFHRVVVGNVPRDFFKNKIVLIGPSYLSNTVDYVLTPHNKDEARSPKLVVHANIIHSLINNNTVKKIPFWVTGMLCLLISIFLSIIISRIQPAKGLIITILTIIGAITLSYLLFVIFGYWLYLTHILLTTFVVYYIWVPFRAIGEYQRRYAIQEESKLLKRVEDLKQNFISLMSHDLKTPVAKIAGVADILIQKHGKEIESSHLEGLNSIIDSTKELNSFITSILDLTKVESRKLTLNMVSKDINKLIENIITGLDYESKRKEIKINIDLGPLFPIKIDVTLMTRVVSNLVENALKYSGKGTCVNVKTWDDDEWVYIEIQDNGVGIPDQDIANIFEKFYRVKNDASHTIKGSGLGLYLVKYFVELHGGMISAESEIGSGTKFIVKLPNK